jgi:hypothetical protein
MPQAATVVIFALASFGIATQIEPTLFVLNCPNESRKVLPLSLLQAFLRSFYVANFAYVNEP